MRRNGRQGRLFATVTLGLAGCLSFPEASPCTVDTDCAGADRCDVASGRCVPRGTAGDPDAGGGGTTGGEPVPGRRWRFVSAGGAEPYRATSRGYVTIDGGSHTCALTGDDRLFCWGANMDGQLGTADPTPRVATPVEVDPAARWRTVSAGAAHTCALRADGPDAGRLYCWGEPEHGRLGLGDPGLVATVAPRPVGNDRDWEAVSAGGAHTCGLRAGGLLFCWGANEFGQVGTGALETPSFRTPQQVGDPGFTQVSAGLAHTCALRNDQTVWCWGAADLGTVGSSQTQICAGGDVCAATPRLIEGLPPDIRQVAAGEAHACALSGDGHVYCWGASFEGAFAADTDITATPVEMNIDMPIRHFDAGGANTCVTTADFSVCFGEGRSGQRGNGFPDDPAAAGALPPLEAGHYTQFSIGGEHVCAITSGGALHCFGSQSDGQLGQGVFSGVTVPTPVAFEDATARVVKVAVAHDDTACALVAGVDAAVSSGDIHCWGDGVEDQLLGQGGPRSAVPVQLTRTGDYIDLAVGERFGCALTENRQVRCWGRGSRGQLGDGLEQGSRGMLVDADVSMAGLSEARLVVGTFHACLVGTVIIEPESVTMAMCWGFNPEGQLGPDASRAGPWRPLPLQAGELGVRAVVQDVALGTTRTFGIAPNGQLVAWGGVRNLFDGTYANRERALSSQYTFDSPAAAQWVRIRAHLDRLCGLRRDGLNSPRIFCADVYAADQADDRGRALDLRAYPDRTQWADVVVGDNVGCGLGSDGRLFCAGYNHFGQLGDGHRSSLEAEQMTQVGGNTLRFHQVAAGAGFMCGVRRADDQPAEDRRLYCWGRGHRGQTGLGVADVSRPVPVPLPDP